MNILADIFRATRPLLTGLALCLAGCPHRSVGGNGALVSPPEVAGPGSGWSGEQVIQPTPSPVKRPASRPSQAEEGSSSEAEDPYRLVLEEAIRQRLWALLGPAGVPPPGIDPSPKMVGDSRFSIILRPLRAEEQEWNRATGRESKLFNNARGYLWEVSIRSEIPSRWVPRGTALHINQAGNVFPAAAAPEECYRDLTLMAWWQMDGTMDLGIEERLSSAGEFHALYLPSDIPPGEHTFVVFFPAPAAILDPVAVQVDLQFALEGLGTRSFSVLFE